ncbi:MAG: glycopeptide antibiotics resistance protein [Pseudoalteromonas distincta]|jgi:glycopeptide antibiotics resistance protein
MQLKRALFVAIAWTALIASSCLMPASAFKAFTFDSIFQLDKILHLTLYYVFIVLWSLVSKVITVRQKYVLLIVGIAYGVLIEVLQAAMSLGRSYELDDIIANTIGCVLGVLSISYIKRKLPLIKKYLPFMSKLY